MVPMEDLENRHSLDLNDPDLWYPSGSTKFECFHLMGGACMLLIFLHLRRGLYQKEVFSGSTKEQNREKAGFGFIV